MSVGAEDTVASSRTSRSDVFNDPSCVSRWQMHPGVTQCVQRSHLASVKQWTPGRVLRFRLGRSGVFKRFRSVSQKETAESRRGSRVVGEGVTAKRRERERRKKTEFARVCV